MRTIICNNCGKEYDVDDLEELNDLTSATAIMCSLCGEHLADISGGTVMPHPIKERALMEYLKLLDEYTDSDIAEFNKYYDSDAIWYMYESPSDPIISYEEPLENREGEMAGKFREFSAEGMYDIIHYDPTRYG